MDTLPPKPRRGDRLSRRLVVAVLAVALVGALTWGMAARPSSALAGRSSWAAAPVTLDDGLEAVATIEGQTFTVHTVGGERTFLPGVNLGVTVPGRYPGELQLTAEDYRRWFPQMIEMGFRAIRVYTVHPPAFYTELERFNREHADTPLYLIHGIWPPEELMFETEDLWDPEVVEAFEHEIDEAVAAVHGELEAYHLRPEFGAYEGDVSPWLVAWAIGAEWEPTIIDASDRRNAGLSPYRGELVSSVERATPRRRGWRRCSTIWRSPSPNAADRFRSPSSTGRPPTRSIIRRNPIPAPRTWSRSMPTTSTRRVGPEDSSPAITPTPTSRTSSATSTWIPMTRTPRISRS